MLISHGVTRREEIYGKEISSTYLVLKLSYLLIHSFIKKIIKNKPKSALSLIAIERLLKRFVFERKKNILNILNDVIMGFQKKI